MYTEALVYCSINTELVDKSDSKQNHAIGFTDYEFGIQKLADHISQGHAFCCQLKGGRRSAKNFYQTNIFSVDIDGGLNYEETINAEWVKSHAALAYTTFSHTEDAHRFRLVFRTEDPITDPEKTRTITEALIRRFKGDARCKDVSRIFYGNSKCTPVLLGRNTVEE